MIARFRQLYGAGPLHLVAVLIGFAIAALALVGWFDRSADTAAVLLWFVAAIVGHDLVLLPLYSAVDRILFRRRPRPKLNPTPYVRIPLILSGLLFLVFFPDILGLGDSTYRLASGQQKSGYLAHWLIATGALFLLSLLAYAVAGFRASRRRS
jgi:hypothetical protein